MLCHLLGYAVFLVPTFGNILGPLVLWLVKRKESPAVDFHGREAVNFQICMTIYFIIAALLCAVLIGFVLLPIVGLLWFICPILAALRAQDGLEYRYPFIFRLIRDVC